LIETSFGGWPPLAVNAVARFAALQAVGGKSVAFVAVVATRASEALTCCAPSVRKS
jgi:hypothetical protein